ncbi:hypothetical protein IWW56_006053 [Coemansia sp. RSA 2131]|nr:hypothetical protein IWW56_006053 [Coemansia sp. RSA 2131]
MKAQSVTLFFVAFIGMIAVGLSAPAPETGIALPGSGETALSWLDRLISPLPLVGPLTKVLGISQPEKQQPAQPQQKPQQPAQQKPAQPQQKPAQPQQKPAQPQQGLPQQRPQQGLPQQRLPQQSVPQQRPQQGIPQQRPQQGLPQQRLPQQRLPQQGMPQQGRPQQGLPQQRPGGATGGIPNRTPAGLGGFGAMPGFT